jgi:rare lipoprotein A
MTGSGGISTFLRRFAGPLGLAAGCLALANCSGNIGQVDPRYGVASSARVVKPGEPVPKGGGVYRVGKPYTVAGVTYTPEVDNHYSKVGLASWYGDDFHGRYTANGEIFDMNAISAASPTLPLPSYARVTNLQNHRSLVVRVNDRGPYVAGRLIDVSVRAARLLGFYGDGVAKVKVEYVGLAPLKGSSDRQLAQTLRDKDAPAPRVKVAAANAPSSSRAYFDPKPMGAAMPRHAPVPRARPYAAGTGAGAQAVAQADASQTSTADRPARPTIELAAATRSSASMPAVTPVSAYVPVKYDGHNGFLSGRGLY